MDINADIKALLNDTKRVPTRQWVEQTMSEYPTFALPPLLFLQRAGINGNDDVLDRLAATVPDARTLMMRLGIKAENTERKLRQARQKSSQQPDTDEAINDFLDTYCPDSDKEIEALNAAIFNPTPDYADILVAQEMSDAKQQHRDKKNVHDKLMDSFIEQSLKAEQQAERQAADSAADKAQLAATVVETTNEDDSSMLSESLAKMYISIGRYEKALEIIQNINLKFPEKSIYFADQIRFLKKVILIKKH